MESLADKLKALGMDLGAGNLSPTRPQKKGQYPIDQVVEGEEIQTIYGKTFTVSRDATSEIEQWHDINQPLIVSPVMVEQEMISPGIIFLDTETSGLCGGTGTYVFMVGIGIYDNSRFTLHQLFMRDPDEEAGFLAALGSLIGDTNLLVTFNGKAFDIPMLNTRHRLVGLTPILSADTHYHLDMLTIARRIWKTRLPGRSLGDLEREILHITRDEEEVPGWMIPEMYFDYLYSGDARPMKRVFYHNAVDIISLAQLFFITHQMLKAPLELTVDNIDLASIARIYEKQNRLDEAIDLYEASLNRGLPVQVYLQTVERYALIFKQKKDWDQAVNLWHRAAELNSFDSLLELAKYYEHILKDIDKAEEMTQKAVKLVKNQVLPPWKKTIMINELNHRLFRLDGKKK